MNSRFLVFSISLVAMSFGGARAQAATIQPISRFSSPALNQLTRWVQQNASFTGDCTSVGAYAFRRTNASELPLKTAQQLAFRTGALGGDDTSKNITEVRLGTASDIGVIAENMLTIYGNIEIDSLDGSDDRRFQRALNGLTQALVNVRREFRGSAIRAFEGMHQYEDGIWSILILSDEQSGQLLLIRLGSCGS